jgi:uroporphyrinogen decarboxylase
MGGEACFPPPVWLMRKAGRYLPEYQAIRAKVPSFLDFCYTPALAAKATLQPVWRFDFDAAILFSDILVVPDALGQKVHFEPNEGPKLNPIVTRQDFAKPKRSTATGFPRFSRQSNGPSKACRTRLP